MYFKAKKEDFGCLLKANDVRHVIPLGEAVLLSNLLPCRTKCINIASTSMQFHDVEAKLVRLNCPAANTVDRQRFNARMGTFGQLY